jgi:pilus assembly protein FimV
MAARASFDEGAPTPAASEAEALNQLGALGDVDPVAEAEVYLAYGRDRQAEDILKEAMRAQPQRLDIPLKLLEIYASRLDAGAFLPLAQRLHDATGGTREPWPQVQSLGRSLQPQHPLFADGANVPQAASWDALALAAPEDGSSRAAVDTPGRAPPDSPPDILPVDLALEAAPGVNRAASADESPLLDIDLGGATRLPPSIDAWPPEPGPSAAPSVAEVAVPDLSGADDWTGDPLERKLALADEFMQIGDVDAARDLLNEVLAQEGPAELQAQARQRLDQLD